MTKEIHAKNCTTRTRPAWEREVRLWARELGATHATVEHCGPRKRLSISGCIQRVAKAHPEVALTVSVKGATLVLSEDGKSVAAVDNPVRKEMVGHDHYGRVVFEMRPVIS